MRVGIHQVEYTTSRDGGTQIHVFGRHENGDPAHVIVNGFRPYFYAAKNQADALALPSHLHPDTTQTYRSIQGVELRRIYTNAPSDVRNYRDGLMHFEADVLFPSRFMIDKGLTSGMDVPKYIVSESEITPADVVAPARVCVMDIECDDSQGFPDPVRDKIICITCWDSFDDAFVTFFLAEHVKDVKILAGAALKPNHTIQSYANEHAMLRGLADYIRAKDPDILTGWNFIDFDFPYTTVRMDALGLKSEWLARLPGKSERHDTLRGRVLFDLLAAYKKMQGEKDSYRLDAIAEDELGERKVRFSGSICNLWKTDPQKLIEYNWKDVDLCVGIDKKRQIVAFYQEVAHHVGCPLGSTLNTSQIIDVYILRKAHDKFVLPSKGYSAGEFEGATVFEPMTGIKENVAVFDLKSLYPMSMVTLNASPETKDPNGEYHSPNGIHFARSPDGLTRSIIAELLEERDAKKKLRNTFPFKSPEYEMYDRQQNVIKVIMNSYYGVSGYARFRLYDVDIASAITATGREIIGYTRKTIEDMGYKVLYGDSVAGDSNVLICDKDGHFLSYGPIANLFTHVDRERDDKEYCNLVNAYTDTIDHNGNRVLRRVPYIMRHRTNKRMYRITMDDAWHLDVTEDHSVIGYSETRFDTSFFEMKPTEIMRPLKMGEPARMLIVRRFKDQYVNATVPCSVDKIGCAEGYVYDIEVEGMHRFFANNILVHNTDSTFVELPRGKTLEETLALAKSIEQTLNAQYPQFALERLNCDKNYFSTKFEKFYGRLFQAGRKKRYAGKLAWKEGKVVDDQDVVGFEIKRSDSPTLTKTVQKEILTMILDGKTRADVKVYLGDIIKRFRKGEYPLDQIAIPGGFGKDLAAYEDADAHVRGAQYANKHFGCNFVRGSKPKRLYISRVKARYPQTDVICFEYPDQVPSEFVIDYETMLDKTLKRPITRIIEAIGWDWPMMDPCVTTLEDFSLV